MGFAKAKTKVLVIDDSAFNRRAITGMLEKIPDVEVIGTATDGEEGLKKAFQLNPDIITLDLEMPVMDGFTFLRLLMSQKPVPVIVVSSRDDDANVFRALEFGAVDFLAKPTHRISRELLNIEKDLIAKVNMVADLKMDNLKKRVFQHRPAEIIADRSNMYGLEKREVSDYEVLAIGSSTGGPPALQSMLSGLSGALPLAIVVSQHMPPGFTMAFAQRLNRLSDFEVKEAADGDMVRQGRVLIAPGGCHMQFKKEGDNFYVKIIQREIQDRYAPSVDKMFLSVADHFGDRAIGIVLTGMGNDGKLGVKAIKKANGYVIAESEETAIVYGMPREAINTGAVDKILPLNEIPSEIIHLYQNEYEQ